MPNNKKSIGWEYIDNVLWKLLLLAVFSAVIYHRDLELGSDLYEFAIEATLVQGALALFIGILAYRLVKLHTKFENGLRIVSSTSTKKYWEALVSSVLIYGATLVLIRVEWDVWLDMCRLTGFIAGWLTLQIRIVGSHAFSTAKGYVHFGKKSFDKPARMDLPPGKSQIQQPAPPQGQQGAPQETPEQEKERRRREQSERDRQKSQQQSGKVPATSAE